MKSRFDEVIFEDYDEEELKTIWSGMIDQRKFMENDDRIKDVVARRLMKSNNRKGFGNARAVRKKLEEAIKNAIGRDD